MSDFILHHYPLSPYSEKVRAMLGYLNADWKSVRTMEMPPRPLLYPLAGGYRRIPVAQQGADIYCDSKIMCNELALKYNKPELSHDNVTAEMQALIDEVEGELFFASVMYASGSKLNKKVLADISLFNLAKLIFDRLKMTRKANTAMPTAKTSGPIVKAFLPKFESLLTDEFLFGNEPTIADFCAYHPLWFIWDLGEKPIINNYPKTEAWLKRIKAFGHGTKTEISAEEAIQIARNAEPLAIGKEIQSHELIGKPINIAPIDYAMDETAGILKAVTSSRYILERNTNEAGVVNVHFPINGYKINPTS